MWNWIKNIFKNKKNVLDLQLKDVDFKGYSSSKVYGKSFVYRKIDQLNKIK